MAQYPYDDRRKVFPQSCSCDSGKELNCVYQWMSVLIYICQEVIYVSLCLNQPAPVILIFLAKLLQNPHKLALGSSISSALNRDIS
jgi:hypothetical protein